MTTKRSQNELGMSRAVMQHFPASLFVTLVMTLLSDASQIDTIADSLLPGESRSNLRSKGLS